MKKIIMVALLSMAMISCGRFSNEDKKQNNSERIVIISKQCTEIIHALNAEENVVAVDLSSVYPPRVKKLPTVGYHRALSLEGLLAAKPTMIIHDGFRSLGPEHIVRQLQELQIPMKEFETKSEDIASTQKLIREIGRYFHKEKRADTLCQKLEDDMAQAKQAAQKYTDTPKVLVIHFGRANNVYLVMTKKSTAAKMINWAGGKMAVTDTSGMRHLSAEVVTQYNPDVILLTDFGYDRLGNEEKIQELPGISSTKAARNHRIYRVNECDMVYLGPRTGEVTLKLQKLIHQKPKS